MLSSKGRFKGFFFRDYTRKKAISLGLRGTVRNKNDGSVEVFARGEDSVIRQFTDWCWEGSPYSSVTSVFAEEVDMLPDYSDFRVIY